jgi:hypothetical protein
MFCHYIHAGIKSPLNIYYVNAFLTIGFFLSSSSEISSIDIASSAIEGGSVSSISSGLPSDLISSDVDSEDGMRWTKF